MKRLILIAAFILTAGTLAAQNYIIVNSEKIFKSMEIYNNAMQQGVHLQPGGFTNLTYAVVGKALVEAAFMGALVMVISSLWGNRLGAAIGARWCDAGRDSPAFCQLMRQAGTVAVMCPTMSLAATILFYGILGGTSVFQLPAVWVGTVLKNFPMAFFWNMFAAAPLVHLIFDKWNGRGEE